MLNLPSNTTLLSKEQLAKFLQHDFDLRVPLRGAAMRLYNAVLYDVVLYCTVKC